MPVPVPSVVFVVRAVVGFVVVPHTIPLALTADPPSDDMFPPLVAVVDAMELAAVVAAKVGATASVVKLIQILARGLSTATEVLRVLYTENDEQFMQATTVRCGNCGCINDRGHRFCQECGGSIENPA